MDRVAHLRQLFDYDAWANREALASLRAAGDPPPAKALRLLAHVVGCERLWLGRLERRPEPAVVWPDLDLAGCAAGIEELAGLWREYLDGLEGPGDFGGPGHLGHPGDTRLGEAVEYVNSLGEPWTSTVGDILTHTVLHSAYHRGQVATELRAAGREPAYTDFIHAVRRGHVVAEGADGGAGRAGIDGLPPDPPRVP